MSMFTVCGKVIHTFDALSKDDTGASHLVSKVQLLGDMPVMGTSHTRLDLVTLTIEDKKNYDLLKEKTIRVSVGFFSPKSGSVIFYIPKGSSPVIVDDEI